MDVPYYFGSSGNEWYGHPIHEIEDWVMYRWAHNTREGLFPRQVGYREPRTCEPSFSSLSETEIVRAATKQIVSKLAPKPASAPRSCLSACSIVPRVAKKTVFTPRGTVFTPEVHTCSQKDGMDQVR